MGYLGRPPITTNYRRCSREKRITSILRVQCVWLNLFLGQNRQCRLKNGLFRRKGFLSNALFWFVPMMRFLFFQSCLLSSLSAKQLLPFFSGSHLYLWILEKKAFFQLANVCHAMLPKKLELIFRRHLLQVSVTNHGNTHYTLCIFHVIGF